MMHYVILYIVVSLLICLICSFIFIKVFLLIRNSFKSQSEALKLSTKKLFVYSISVAFIMWIAITIFILSGLEMH
jgi:hypothetical protein